MKRAAIIGVGLMGGSLGLALARRRGWRVAGLGRHPARLRRAKALGGAHGVYTDFEKGLKGADVVVLAAPVADIVPLARRIRPFLSAGALVMDVGSVKGPIVAALEKVYSSKAGPHFVGVHPMTGSEKTGVGNARADLYRGATCVVTPGPRTPAAAVRRAEAFWRSVGGRVLRLPPAEHDRWVAMVSHLPHLLADVLVLTAAGWGRNSFERVRALAAGSFRDATRVAGADPAQWAAIFRMNARHLKEAAAALRRPLEKFAAGRWTPADLRRANALRGQFIKDHSRRSPT